jgi:glycerophosphoryl diester phosphodiesterase
MAISHRGAHDELPENSVPAFLRALELGAEGVELDVHSTADGVLVVHHDAELAGGGIIRKLTYPELSTHFLAPDIGIPRLVDVLDSIGSRATVFIEAKATGIEMLLLRAVRETSADCAIHSFDRATVYNLKRLFPALRTGVLTSGDLGSAISGLRETVADDLWHLADDIVPEIVSAAHKLGKRVIAWTSNKDEQWRRLAELEVDGICTDRIGAFTAEPLDSR